MVESFGDGRRMEDEEPEPPFGLPRIAVMMVPVVDEEALEAVVEQVRDAIAQAVRAGFADAMGEMFVVDDDETPEMPVEVPFDAHPTVNYKDRFAYQKYAERLDREVPGWWRIPVPSMAEELRKLAAVRQVRDGAGPPSPPKPPTGLPRSVG